MSESILPIRRALISVSDKTGLIILANALRTAGVTLLSTGGTAKSLREAGFDVTDVSDVTGFPEIMDGRVKTLHPAIHGGLLAKRDKQEHMSAIAEHQIEPIDLLVVNLYPFEQVVAKGADNQTAIENIDIGGPAMIRASAKNHDFVTVITSPEQYSSLIDVLSEHSGTSIGFRRSLAQQAFARTSAYDHAIALWMSSHLDTGKYSKSEPDLYIQAPAIQTLRYGENPHQTAAIYATDLSTPSVLTAKQIQGKPLSYNNVNDTDAALRLVCEFSEPTIAIIKHANPCGVATAARLQDAWQEAYLCDTVSAFGGIVASNTTIDEDTARSITSIFSEVVIAPDATSKACEILSQKPNIRLLLTGSLPDPTVSFSQVRTILGGYLVQSRDTAIITEADLTITTKRQPSPKEVADMLFAWKIAKHVKSNAIIYVKDQITAAIGAGQMSRLDSSRIAAQKARDMAQEHGWQQPRTVGSAVASDAFFPFPDGLLSAVEAGATAVIQPGGSMRDDAVIKAADEAGITMAFTGIRHFNH